MSEIQNKLLKQYLSNLEFLRKDHKLKYIKIKEGKIL
jgi:hypothetical protein